MAEWMPAVLAIPLLVAIGIGIAKFELWVQPEAKDE